MGTKRYARKRSAIARQKTKGFEQEVAVDEKKEFDKWRSEFLPLIRKDLLAGLSAQEILKKYKAQAAARMVMALVNPEARTAVSAAKDIMDRTGGKAKESIIHTHKYEEMTDAEIVSHLKSLRKDVDTVTKPKKH